MPTTTPPVSTPRDLETASDIFSELQSAARLLPDSRRASDALDRAFQRFLNQKTVHAGLNIVGPFAKTDYLLKEHGAPASLAKAVGDTRNRLRHRHELSDSDLSKHFLYDLGSVSRFVALVCGASLPDGLLRLLPAVAPRGGRPSLVGECIRAIVERWDDEFVYVKLDAPFFGQELAKVSYARGNVAYDYDWTYLKDMFARGAQLNLVRPREQNGVVFPELVVYEPDFLVNISTVAHCFTNYADSALVDVVKRLETVRPTEATLLGGMAGQLLDEAIHNTDATRPYSESVADFFQAHAVGLMATDIDRDFHDQALKQRANIERALHQTLPSALSRFDLAEGMVEPSFFSEMLGLQGRMDYLQTDFKVLLEQKSGKGAFPYGDFTKPRQTEEHYVQLLLYMALIRYNFRKKYEQNSRELHAFLLYSKYTESLLGLGFAPELIFKAMKVRNELAWQEMQLTRPDAYRTLLQQLSPQALNVKGAAGALWTKWQQPQIERVLSPIASASELERAYYFRFLTFIANEHALAKLGTREKEGTGFASTWHDSLDEKRLAGNIYDRLTLTSPGDGHEGRVDRVELSFPEEAADSDVSNFRVGDIVMLYSYDPGCEPDARKTMAYRCTVDSLTASSISLALRAPQADARLFLRRRDALWAVEHDFMEASFGSLYRSMHSFLSAPRQRRDLLLMQRAPEAAPSATLRGSYGDFDQLVLRVKRARDMFLIIGPPGTGKTSYALLNTVLEELLEPASSVLLMAYTNRAVDEICGKLDGAGIDFVRVGNPFSCADDFKDRLLSSRVASSKKLSSLRQTLLEARVFVGTTSAVSAAMPLLGLRRFSLAVIDEASQILEPHLMGLLCAASDGEAAIRKFVLIGDHKQLPAVVMQDAATSGVSDPSLRAIHLTDCRQSLFERMLRKYAADESVTYMLTRQGRMHPDIALFPNRAFYGGLLQPVPLPHQTSALPAPEAGADALTRLLLTRRVAFIDSEAPEGSPSDKVNLVEAEMIAALAVKIFRAEQPSGFDHRSTLGIIVPYRNQIAAVRKAIGRHGIEQLLDVSIDTVERFQGSQRKYIIYGFTVQKRYQLKFLAENSFEDADGTVVDRKLNVAMTRAQEHIVMVGRANLLAQNDVFGRLLSFVRSRGGYFSVPLQRFLDGDFCVN